ncbi:hypothetical protein [Pseudarthrobacter cellobiosi]|nr:hypothetical protein [Pseudarthrobacter sp. HLT3-5]
MAGMSAGNSGEFVGGAIQDGALDTFPEFKSTAWMLEVAGSVT